jgi:hypothetical protein
MLKSMVGIWALLKGNSMIGYKLLKSEWFHKGEPCDKRTTEKLEEMVNRGYNPTSEEDHTLFEMEILNELKIE